MTLTGGATTDGKVIYTAKAEVNGIVFVAKCESQKDTHIETITETLTHLIEQIENKFKLK